MALPQAAAGKCESGGAPDACGTNGASCGRCGTGTTCQAGECRASGSGGASTPGGSTGGGNTSGCRTVPLLETFTSNTRYRTCTACATFYESCDPMTAVCARSFLGQSGSLTISGADRAVAGRLVGSGANVRFNQWDLESDRPDGTACAIATTIGPFNIGWNADGGMIP